LISKLQSPESILGIIDGKIHFKEMLDYNFITDSLKEGKLKNFEKYSLYVNVQELWSGDKHKTGNKKVKRDSDNDTVKLSNSD
jgi:hypothetical protein